MASPLAYTNLPDEGGVTYTNTQPTFEQQDAVSGRGNIMGRAALAALYGAAAGRQANDVMAAELAGDEARKASALRAHNELAARAAYEAPNQDLRKIGGVGDAVDFVRGAVGNAAVTTLPSIAGAALFRGRGPVGKAAAFGGAYAPAYVMERDEALSSQYQDPEQMKASAQERDLAATAKGGINAALESIVPAGLGGAFLRKPAGSFLGHVGRNAATETATEGAQHLVGYGAQKYIDPNKELDPWDVANAAAAGAVGGGGLSAVMRGPSHAVQAILDKAPKPQMPEIKNPFQRGGEAGEAGGVVDLPEDPSGGGSGPADTMLGKVAGLGAAVQDRFGDDIAAAGGKAKDMAGKAKDIVSDTLDRMTEAVDTSANPGEFLSKVFGGSIDEEAAADLSGEPNPMLKGITFEETEANIARDDEQRVARAARYADELLNDPATPEQIKQRVAAMGGDYANPDNQSFVARTLVAQRGGEKIAKAVQDLVDLGKSAFAKGSEAASEGLSAAKKAVGDAATAAQDRIVKKNLQSATPAEQAAFGKVVFDGLTDEAKANPAVRRQLSDVTNAMMAFAAKTGDVTAKDLPTLTKLSNAMSLFKDPDAMAQTLVEYAGLPRTEDSFLSRIKRITNAQQDLKQPNSFLVSSLTPEATKKLTGPMLQRLAQFVDEFSLKDAAGKGDQILEGLTQAFGSKENAQVVLDFYAQQNKADLRFDPTEGMDEHGDSPINEQDASALQPKFRSPNINRPFLRGRDDAALRAAAGDGLTGTLREHVAAKKGNAKLTALDIRRDLQRRLDENVSRDTESVRGALAALDAHLSDAPQSGEWAGMEDARKLRDKLRSTKTEDRSAVVKALRDELSAQDKAMEQAKRAGKDPHEALLDLYGVALTQADESKASDEQMTKFRELLDKGGKDPEKNKAIRKTAVTFPIGGKKVAVSLESMIYNSPEKGSIKERLLASLGLVAARADSMPDIKPDTIVKRNYYGKDQHLTWGALMGLNPKFTAKERKQNFKETAEGAARKAALDKVSASNLRDYLKSLPQDVDALATSVKILGNVEKAQKELRVHLDRQPTKELGQQAQQLASKARVLKSFINEILDADYPIDRETILERLQDEQEETSDQGSDTAYKDILVAEAQMEALRDRADAVKGTKLADQYEGRAEEIASELDRALSRLQPWQRMNEEDRPSGRKTPVDAAREAEYARRAKEDKALAEEDAQRPKAEPGTARQSTMEPKRGRPGKIDQQAILDEIARIRGKGVKVAFAKFADIGASGEFSMNRDKTNRLIKIAINSLNPMSVAWHESLHDFMAMLGGSKAERKLKADLLDAAEAPQVKKKLRELLEGHPDAIKQIETDREERLAYMYQFWAEGLLPLGPTGNNIFSRAARFFREMLGVLSQDQKIDQLFTALHTGKFSEPSLVAAVLEDLKAQTLGDKLRAVSGPIGDAAEAMFTGATDRLRDTNVEALAELADMFHREPGRENSGELPFLQRRSQQVGKRLNKLQDILKDTTSEERRRALENMQAMKPASSPLEKELAAYLKEMRDYMVDRGVKRLDTKPKKWAALGNVKDYFPRVWDKETIRNNEAEFINLMAQYIGEAQAHETFKALVNGDGSLELAENEHHLGFTPWNPSVLDRKFTFIDPSNAAEFAKFQSKDMADIMTSYTQRAVHRAEYAHTFGNDGEVIAKKFLEAQKQGATQEELEMAHKATMAMEGTLGYAFNPRLKEVMSGIMTYQNIVLLPLSLFSSLIDPLGVAMRSNDMKEAWNAFKYGMKGIADQLRGAGDDAQTEMAKTLGLIDDQNMLEAMGHVYNSMHMSRTLKKINSKFFRYNGMEMWNQRMRVAAMMAAQRFILANLGHERYMKELGITDSDVFQLQDGTIALTKDQLLQAGAKKSEVSDIEKRIQAAVFKWVDGAVLRPNAAHRPVWGSDPRYQLIFHLKQFTFSFHNTILRRVGEELKHGNVAPGWILMSYVPFMFLSDVLKGSLTGTLNTTADLYDVASQSIARSGIMGTGVFGADAMGDLERGKLPGTSFLGPAFDHLMTLLSGITGHAGVDQVMNRSVPFAKYV